MQHIKTELKVDQVYLSYPYLVTFADEATNVYEIQSSSLQHVTSLSQTITGYIREGAIIIDPSRDALIIVQSNVFVFNLHDGQLQKTLTLFGTLTDAPILYDRGRVLVTLSDETDEDGEQKEDFWILSCNPFDLEPAGYSFLTQIRRPCTDKHMLYNHVLSSHEGGVVVGQHTSFTNQPLKLHYWSPEGQPYDDSLPPAYTVDIPITLPEGNAIEARYAASIDDDCFALCTVEAQLGVLDGPGVHQSVIRTLSLPSLDILWTAQAIDGQVNHVYHLRSEGIVLAIGTVSERNDSNGGDANNATWIVALDVEHGERRQFTKFNHRNIGKELVRCSLTTSATEEGEVTVSDEPDIVFITSGGDVAKVSVSKFLEEGLPSDEFGALEIAQSAGIQLKDVSRLTLSRRASISQQSVVVLDDGGVVSVFTW
ncbi:hypothetical protein VNI00_005746 [Paramarasmius palmivorus]|uniref:Cleavage/polyadenylation specificity factor A subunit N-terminal domain-containing protein n=1 Tax=Paramarasmius palmivorus TaxID=297713 RepID=A0AAW0DD84_9AGAR